MLLRPPALSRIIVLVIIHCPGLHNRTILGEKNESEARNAKKLTPVRPNTIVQAVPESNYERGYPIGYFTSRDPRMFFKDVTRSHIYSLIGNSDLNQQRNTITYLQFDHVQ